MPRTPSKRSTRRAPAEPVPPAFSRQRAHATRRDELLFELTRARAAVRAAVQGLGGGNAERPVAPGKWSIKEIVLHLGERDRARLEEFDSLLAGRERSWAGLQGEPLHALNEAHLAPLRALSWDDAVRRTDRLRDELVARLLAVPAEPVTPWEHEHAFGAAFWHLPQHDRHHAQQIKLARIGGPAPTEE